MVMKKIIFSTIFLVYCSFLYSQNYYSEKGSIDKINMDLTLKYINDNKNALIPVFKDGEIKDKKSLFLAGMFSAIIPGSGEFYTENYWQSILFIGIEAASWIVNIKYNKKGDDQTNFYQNYANEHWSVVRYANWIERNLDKIVPDQTNVQKCRVLFQSVYKPGDKPWEQINWDKLNEIERIIGSGGGKGQAFSHTLPYYGEQQYFELIGKYPQFSQGWDDSDQNDNGDFYDRVTNNFKYYSSERGKANDYYNIASTFASIIVVNHIVSAIDAVLMAHFYNKAHLNVSYNSNVLPNGKISIHPNFHLSINF